MTSKLLTENDFHFLNNRLENDCLTSPSDDRTWKSYVRDIYGGDNFADHCKDFFKMLEEEEYWD